ncbi:hypothetical protein P3T36_006363 [Kitasatospora sp. MAP12-15]|uniref:hypothetical protein n=1 Tax=unclassified Kitasatospora TaxID=2633591 RepID=UPI00247373B1|nr:hypothetical protein [Kitasatospora sp. MAP12-44]MDH6107904.1 hypothetical protein [Kitasatospora sp. MAP12-44]
MATALLPRTALHPTLSPQQRHQAATAIRSIGRLAPRPHRSRYACATCSVAWTGPEADCFSCGRPATHAHNDASLLHRLLLAPVTPRKAGPR